MTTSRLIPVAAAILAFAAPVAAARPSADRVPVHPDAPVATGPATIAVHKERLATEQYAARTAPSVPATPLADRTGTGGVPVGLVLIGLAVPGGLGVMAGTRRLRSRHRAPARLT